MDKNTYIHIHVHTHRFLGGHIWDLFMKIYKCMSNKVYVLPVYVCLRCLLMRVHIKWFTVN